MNIDARIRKELQDQTTPLDEIDPAETGLFGMLHRVFTGTLRRWAAYGMLLTLVLFGLTVWCIVRFTGAADVDGRLLWGLGALMGFHAVSMLKLWFFMEMNRNSVLREIKRVEAAVIRLGNIPDEAA
ncbi:MAG: hypothetical protein GW900_01670 [Gammaproteobacteria bacterium]|nr:hypothetical protein [Gammaproteobacteria bacterium]